MKAIKKSDRKLQMRQQAKRKVGGSKFDYSGGGAAAHRAGVAQGLKNLNQVASEGGDSAAKKIKAEITYLLNNYLPSYDNRIQALINQWRTSGDPSYDPAIKIKLRQARQNHMKGNSA
jgi:hypothetical protein